MRSPRSSLNETPRRSGSPAMSLPRSDAMRTAISVHSRAATVGRMRAIWNGTVLAESDDTVVVEGNHYFPAESLNRDALAASSRTSICPWKGIASYYSVHANGDVKPDAAWYYPNPRD